MQTFMPYTSFKKCATTLDRYRLGKQRVECLQILVCLGDSWAKEALGWSESKAKRWKNHPTVKMWAGYEELLKLYYNAIVQEWISRGYENNLPLAPVDMENIRLPKWYASEEFHNRHKEILIRKQKESRVPLDRDYEKIFKGGL